MTRPQFDAWLKIHTPVARAPVHYQQLPPPIALPISTEDDAADDAAIVARIRDEADALGVLMIWEDDEVILYWPDEDIDQLLGMSYEDALRWLATDGAQQAELRQQQREIAEANAKPIGQAPPTITIAQLDQCMPASWGKLGYYWKSAQPITAAHSDGWTGEAPTIALAIALVADREKARNTSEPITVFPALSQQECKALIREAQQFIERGIGRDYPTIGKALRIAARMALEATE